MNSLLARHCVENRLDYLHYPIYYTSSCFFFKHQMCMRSAGEVAGRIQTLDIPPGLVCLLLTTRMRSLVAEKVLEPALSYLNIPTTTFAWLQNITLEILTPVFRIFVLLQPFLLVKVGNMSGDMTLPNPSDSKGFWRSADLHPGRDAMGLATEIASHIYGRCGFQQPRKVRLRPRVRSMSRLEKYLASETTLYPRYLSSRTTRSRRATISSITKIRAAVGALWWSRDWVIEGWKVLNISTDSGSMRGNPIEQAREWQKRIWKKRDRTGHANPDLWRLFLGIVRYLAGEGAVVRIKYLKKVEAFITRAAAEECLGEVDVEYFLDAKESKLLVEDVPTPGSKTKMAETMKEHAVFLSRGVENSLHIGAMDKSSSLANAADSDSGEVDIQANENEGDAQLQNYPHWPLTLAQITSIISSLWDPDQPFRLVPDEMEQLMEGLVMTRKEVGGNSETKPRPMA